MASSLSHTPSPAQGPASGAEHTEMGISVIALNPIITGSLSSPTFQVTNEAKEAQ